MILITIDGLNWIVGKEYFSDLFKIQSMRMIRNTVRRFTDTIEKGSPTVVGLFCLWSGVKTNQFSEKVMSRLGTIKDGHPEENFVVPFEYRDGKPTDSIFKYFDRCKVQITHSGPCPYDGYRCYLKHFTGLGDNVKLLPSEELGVFGEIHKNDYDFFHIHTGIGKLGVLQPGPYEQVLLKSVRTYEEFRKDKPLKKEIFINGFLRYKYTIQNVIEELAQDQIICVTADHGTCLDLPMTPEQIDEIPLIVNRKIDLDKYNYQWDMKDLLIKLKEMEKHEN